MLNGSSAYTPRVGNHPRSPMKMAASGRKAVVYAKIAKRVVHLDAVGHKEGWRLDRGGDRLDLPLTTCWLIGGWTI